MDDSEKMLHLKAIVGGKDDDVTLLSYLYQAQSVILGRMYPYLSDSLYSNLTLPEKYSWKQIRIAAYLLNKRGAEGELSHSENGTGRSYASADVPSEMLIDVLPMVGIPG